VNGDRSHPSCIFRTAFHLSVALPGYMRGDRSHLLCILCTAFHLSVALPGYMHGDRSHLLCILCTTFHFSLKNLSLPKKNADPRIPPQASKIISMQTQIISSRSLPHQAVQHTVICRAVHSSH
jgi:hypothetical protein